MESYLKKNGLNVIHDLSKLYGEKSINKVAINGPYWSLVDLFAFLDITDKYVLHGHDLSDTLIITCDEDTNVYVNELGVLLVMLHYGVTSKNVMFLKSVTDYIIRRGNILNDETLGPFPLVHLYSKYIGKASNSGTRAVSVMFNKDRLASTSNDVTYIGPCPVDIAEKVSMKNRTSLKELINELERIRDKVSVFVADAFPETPMRLLSPRPRKSTDYCFTEVVHIFKTDPRLFFDIIDDSDLGSDTHVTSTSSRIINTNDGNIRSINGKPPSIRRVTLTGPGVIKAALLSACPSIRRHAIEGNLNALTALLTGTLLEVKYLCRSKSGNIFYSDTFMKSNNITDCVPVYADDMMPRQLLIEENSISNIWYYIVHKHTSK